MADDDETGPPSDDELDAQVAEPLPDREVSSLVSPDPKGRLALGLEPGAPDEPPPPHHQRPETGF